MRSEQAAASTGRPIDRTGLALCASGAIPAPLCTIISIKTIRDEEQSRIVLQSN